MRAMSYCMMLGPLEKVQNLVKRKAWPIVLPKWYEYSKLLPALCAKW
jgi:hypothetical protein